MITQILLLLFAAMIAAYFLAAVGIRELALRAALVRCKKLEIQLLDQSISLRKIWLKRGDDKMLHFWRSYRFEFTSTGDERYLGEVVTLGKKVVDIKTQAYRIPEQDTTDQSLH